MFINYATDILKARGRSGHAPVGSQNQFIGQCRRYLEEISALFERGADAYLTSESEEVLRRFNSFLRESLVSEKVTRKIVLEVGGSFFPIRGFEMRKVWSKAHSMLSLPLQRLSVRLA